MERSASQLQHMLEKQGFTFQLGQKVAQVQKAGAGVKATIEPSAGGEATMIDADVVLVAVGRRPAPSWDYWIFWRCEERQWLSPRDAASFLKCDHPSRLRRRRGRLALVAS
jgi:NADH dehydrogenase FAD-containing subunit